MILIKRHKTFHNQQLLSATNAHFILFTAFVLWLPLFSVTVFFRQIFSLFIIIVIVITIIVSIIIFQMRYRITLLFI